MDWFFDIFIYVGEVGNKSNSIVILGKKTGVLQPKTSSA